MAERVIPLVDERIAALRAAVPAQAIPAIGLLGDALGRPLRDLRISVTDRCNFLGHAVAACPRKSSTRTTLTCRIPRC